VEWYFVATAATLWAYFAIDGRLTLALVAPAYFYLMEGLRWLSSRWTREASWTSEGRHLALACAVALLLYAGTMWAPSVPRTPGISRYDTLGQWLTENLGPDDAFVCDMAPWLSVVSGRRGYTYRFGIRPERLDDARYGRLRYAVYENHAARPETSAALAARAEAAFDVPVPGGAVRVLRLRPGVPVN
jgi:hypothetical protein